MIRFFNTIFFLLLFPIVSFTQNENYPTPPKTDNLLFYIQRNHNANTIVYDAKYDSKGNLNTDEPITVYWRRYDEQGQKMELRTVEKWYAYGVDWKKIKNKKSFEIKLVANENHKFFLQQLAPNKSIITTKINKKNSILDHIYIFADNTGIWPKVKYIELFGVNINSNEKTYEKLMIE